MRRIALEYTSQLCAVLISGQPIALALLAFVAGGHVAEHVVELALCVNVYGVHDDNLDRGRLLIRKALCQADIGLQRLGAFGYDGSGDGGGWLGRRDIHALSHGVVVEVGGDVGGNGFPDIQGHELLLKVGFGVFRSVSVVMSVATMVQHIRQWTYPKSSTTAFFAVSRTAGSASSQFATSWLE